MCLGQCFEYLAALVTDDTDVAPGIDIILFCQGIVVSSFSLFLLCRFDEMGEALVEGL